MLSLKQYLEAKQIGKSAFARKLSDRLGRVVPPQSMHRWTLPIGDKDYSVPRKKVVEAIAKETGGEVPPSSWYANGVPPRRKARATAVSVAASRKGAATRRHQARA